MVDIRYVAEMYVQWIFHSVDDCIVQFVLKLINGSLRRTLGCLKEMCL